MNLASPITSVPGIGPAFAKKLARLQVFTVFDLIYHLPFRYEDRSRIYRAASVQPGETVTLVGTLDKVTNTFTRRGKNLQTANFTDASGSLPVIWFNQSFLSRTLTPGSRVALYGKIDFFSRRPALISPEYELMTGQPFIHMGRLVPIYPETLGLSSKWLRTKIFSLLHQLDLTDYFPPPPEFLSLQSALTRIHFPDQLDQVAPARHRLAFDELFLLHLTALLRRAAWLKTKLTHPFAVDNTAVAGFISSLPFALTLSQKQAITEILSDLSLPHPANRLLEGDVGSGKTVVAAVAAYVSYLNGFQTLFLAPTQILAVQHRETLSSMFTPFGIDVGLITSQSKAKTVQSKFKIVVGTHALLSKKIEFDRVGLVVIDEQHRFGVAQRALATQTGRSPHILTMTATPIPRTIALTLYGDLDLSWLEFSPAGRLPVKTWVVPEAKRQAAYRWLAGQISDLPAGRQAFIVCPFIDDSETLSSVRSATSEFQRLQDIFPQFRLGLLHGRLKSAEKTAVIDAFRAGQTQILVSTPVVEVGIDVPNAAVIVIEAADRFGLAQLHQLRGRVGRSSHQSYCLLFSETPDTARLKALETHHSGRQLAEIDLRLRGPGQIYGTAQHGSSQFKVAAFSDLDIIATAKTNAQHLLPRLSDYPVLLSLIKDDKINIVQPN